jgi:hypothetical protein
MAGPTNPRVGELLDRADRLAFQALALECPDLHALVMRGRAAALFGNKDTYAACSRQVEEWIAARHEDLPLSAKLFVALAETFPDAEETGDVILPDLGGD